MYFGYIATFTYYYTSGSKYEGQWSKGKRKIT